MAEVTKKKNPCHNCGSAYHYAIEKFPEEEIKEDSESNSMGEAIRENSYYDQNPIKECLVEYHDKTQLEIQDIQLEACLPQDTSNKNLCKHTQDSQTFLLTVLYFKPFGTVSSNFLKVKS
ncbi:hypothetical protein O181_014899 [Austropuccinia psidii MF-1]|uniref:Uncharacterized protein n=1 Tax=Austropuccinia psidii MF-1 TaxID=1389203 RepID=A0A9Q3BYZ8_9BASI|nr:hypothetical protein [Austropuccinia psidii MF-1]